VAGSTNTLPAPGPESVAAKGNRIASPLMPSRTSRSGGVSDSLTRYVRLWGSAAGAISRTRAAKRRLGSTGKLMLA